MASAAGVSGRTAGSLTDTARKHGGPGIQRVMHDRPSRLRGMTALLDVLYMRHPE